MLCLARGYKGRPLVRTVLEPAGRVVYVADRDGGDPADDADAGGVGFPPYDVFELDRALADRLERTFRSGDERALADLWVTATRLAL